MTIDPPALHAPSPAPSPERIEALADERARRALLAALERMRDANLTPTGTRP